MNNHVNTPAVRDLLHASVDSETAQRQALLQNVLAANVNCEFGRKHAFASIRSVSDFQRAVPICDYEQLRSDIERMAGGESGVLTSEPVRRFFITSGSMAAPKYVPVTASLIRDKSRAFQIFWKIVAEAYPALARGCLVFNFSDSGQQQRTAAGLLCSSESSFWNACWRGMGGNNRCPFPREITAVADPHCRYYMIARILLETDLTALMTLNPSTMLLLADVINREREKLIKDVADGGLSREIAAPGGVREYIGAQFKPNRSRAGELEKVLSAGETAVAGRLWPNLQIAVCWRSPMLRPYLELLAPFLGELPQRDYPTMASEAIMTIPFQDSVSGGILPVHTHFYEFIPEAMAEQNNPLTLLAHELEIGNNYALVVTTSAGLYRYNIGDVVRVSGFNGSTPILEFLHRAGRSCSLSGEKLTESQVADAVRQAASRFGLTLGSYTLCPASRPYPHYVLLAEFNDGLNPETSSRFLSALDHDLGVCNIEYSAKRSSQRLGAPELCLVSPGSYASLRQQRIAAGANDAQVKQACLIRELDWDKQFHVLERVSCESSM
jgi:GH3 auxin-responsive promoter